MDTASDLLGMETWATLGQEESPFGHCWDNSTMGLMGNLHHL